MKDEKWYHFYPEKEEHKHKLDNNADCPCKPEIVWEERLIVHKDA